MQPSLTRLGSLTYGFVLIGIVLAGIAFFLILQDTQKQSHRHYGEYVSRILADAIHEKLRHHQKQLRKLATTEEVINTVKFPQAHRDTWAQENGKKFGDGLRLRLLDNKPPAEDTRHVPHFSYACMNMIQNLQADKKNALAELHLSATPSAHIAMIQAVSENGNTIGYLALSLAIDSLAPVLRDHPARGYFEIRQYNEDKKFIVITTSEKKFDIQNQAPLLLVAVADTNWKVAFWADKSIETGPAIGMPVILLLSLALLVTLAGLVWSWFILRKKLQRDVKILTFLANDIRLGRLQQSYPVKLKESIQIAETLLQAGTKIISDIKNQKSSSQTDDLTGLPTLKAFNKRMEQLFSQNKLGFPSSLMLIDIDHFARANEQYGHDTADLLLKNFAFELKRLVRQGDYVARMGGSSFAIVFSLAELRDAEEIQKRVSERMPMYLPVGKTDLAEIRWSAGLSTMSSEDKSIKDVFMRAEKVLKQAKDAGGNQFWLDR